MLVELVTSVGHAVMDFGSAQEFLAAYQGETGCLLCDIRLPGMTGLQLQDQLAAMKSSLPIIFITGHGDISMTVRAMKRGAVDFLCKPINNNPLLEQIHNIISSNDSQMDYERDKSHYKKCFSKLTIRESEILVSIVDGRSSKDIATNLNISRHTVEVHRANIIKKTEARNLGHLIGLAFRYDIVGLR